MTLPRFTLRQLRAFVQAYKLRNLTHAAESLHMTQSAMSALILQLEESLGVQLFERTPRMLRPTEAAEEAFALAEEILSRSASLQLAMRERERALGAVLSFTCVPALASSVMPTVIARFEQQMPGVRVIVHDELDAALLERVLSGKVEFSVSTFEFGQDAVTQTPLAEDFVSVICHQSCALASKERVTWADLLDHRIINLFKGVTMQSLMENIFPINGRSLEPAFEIGYIHTALAMAAQCLGVVILPGHLVQGNPHFASLVARKLHDPEVEQSLYLHTRKGHILSEPSRVFVQLLRDHLASS